MKNVDFHTLFTVTPQPWSLLKQNCDIWKSLECSCLVRSIKYFVQSYFIFWENTQILQTYGPGVQYPLMVGRLYVHSIQCNLKKNAKDNCIAWKLRYKRTFYLLFKWTWYPLTITVYRILSTKSLPSWLPVRSWDQNCFWAEIHQRLFSWYAGSN